MDQPTVTIYTDGGASPNPGAGGWGAVLIFEQDGKEHIRELNGGALDTTNNRMELTAALEALKTLKRPCHVEFYTDSQYLKKGINEWLEGWKVSHFKNGKIQNVDLWKALDTEVERHDIRWHWVKGHAGNFYNERVDKLATAGRPAVEDPSAAADESADGEISAHAYLAISCLGAPGPGAWAILFDQNGEQRIMTGGHPRTNAARLDLLAAIAALEAVPEGDPVRIFTVSSYLRDGITQWVNGWKKSGWMKKTGGEVQYRNLWQYLDQLAAARKVQWTLVKSTSRPTPMAALDPALQEAVTTAKGMQHPPAEPSFKG